MYPGEFRFDLRPDDGVTARLEVSLIFDYQSNKKAVIVHSKANGQGYP